MNNYQIKKVFVIHDFGYTNKSYIPSESLDGKDTITTEYIIIDNELSNQTEYDLTFDTNGRYDTLTEAQEELSYM